MKTLQRAGIYVAMEIEFRHIPLIGGKRIPSPWEGILGKTDRLSQSACPLSQRELPGAGLSAPVDVYTELIVPLEMGSWISLNTPKVSWYHSFFFFFTGVELLYRVVLSSAVQQSESAIWTHTAPLSWISFSFVPSNEHWGFLHPIQ